MEKQKYILNENDLDHSLSIGYLNEPSDGEVSIQNGRYVSPGEDDTTHITVLVVDQYGSYYVSNSWRLYEEGSVLTSNSVCPPDGAAIFWNENHWQPTSVGRSLLSSNNDYVSYGGYSSDGGILAEVDVPAPESDNSRDELYGSFNIELESVSDSPEDYPIKGTYKHTYIDTKTKTCTGLSAGVSLGPASISADGDVQDWEMAAQDSP